MADTFKGPPKKAGVIGRLALDRQLSDYGFDILVSISGMRSETIQIQGEAANGTLLGPVEIQPEKSATLIPDAIIQNGVFVIHIDDLKREWDSLAFVKSGNDDRVILTIESPFEYVERIEGKPVSGVVTPLHGWGLDEWGNMRWGG